MRRCGSLLLYLLLIPALALFLLSCQNSKKNLIKKIYNEDIHLKDYGTDENGLSKIEHLLAGKMYGPALSELKKEIRQTPVHRIHPRIFILLSEALIGLGRVEDASNTLSFAKSAFNHNNHHDNPNYRENVLNFLESITHNAPLTLMETIVPDTMERQDYQLKEAEHRVTNSFYETDLRQALFDISMQAGVTIVWDESVEGSVTYEAMEAPLEEVLHHILFANGLTFIKTNGIYLVSSADIEDKSFREMSETHVVTLSNLDANEAVNLLAEPFRPYVSASTQSNLVGVSAPAILASRIMDDLSLIDRPLPQIEIEAIVVEFSTSKIKKLGTDWGISSSDWQDKAVDFSIATPDMGDAVLALTYLRSAMKWKDKLVDWTASIRALSDAGVAKIRATPRIRTIHGQTAVLGTTKEQYFFISSGSEGGGWGYYNRLETIRSGINIEITPYVDDNNFITVHVKPQVDDVVGEGTSGLPEISRRNADTRVRVRDGETITIGGLRIDENKKIQKGVPFLSKIPLLSYLFSSTETVKVEKELVIFVTPHVLTR